MIIPQGLSFVWWESQFTVESRTTFLNYESGSNDASMMSLDAAKDEGHHSMVNFDDQVYSGPTYPFKKDKVDNQREEVKCNVMKADFAELCMKEKLKSRLIMMIISLLGVKICIALMETNTMSRTIVHSLGLSKNKGYIPEISSTARLDIEQIFSK